MEKTKTKFNANALVIALTFAATLFALLLVNAEEEIPTHAFLAVSPNPAGVNQEVTLLMWLLEFEHQIWCCILNAW